MRISIGYRLRFQVPAPTPMLLQLQVYPGRYRFIHPERLEFSPPTASELFSDEFGNASRRLVAPAGTFQISNQAVVEASEEWDAVDWQAVQHPIDTLPLELFRYLAASRYCEIDRLAEFAWKQFGSGPTGYLRVHAVCAFVHQHLTFGYAFARATKSAFEAFNERQGVCRDFAHLAITLCRCLGIPARYATGYLGDIGVPPDPAPMDFSAWFEAYLSGTWFTFDARHHAPRLGRIVMAYGRDAADTALTTSFGATTLTEFTVFANQLAEQPRG